MKPRVTRRARASVAVLAALVVAGCNAGSTSGGRGDSPTSLTVAFTSPPANLDFTKTAGAAIPQALVDNVYEGLVTLDQDGKIQPALATSWTVSPDRKTYEFTLRKGVKFSNGAPFDAQAVRFSLERVVSKDWTVPEAKYLRKLLDRVEPVGEDKVRVVLKQPSNDFLFRMTTRIGMMFAPNGVGDLANTPVGTGPYKVTGFTRGRAVDMTRRDDYWGAKPAMTQVTFRYFTDPTAMNNALFSGTVDIMGLVATPQVLGRYKGNSRYRIINGPTNAEVVLSMNNKSPDLADVRVRKAISHAIDRQGIIDTAMDGYGTPIGSMVPPTDPWYEDLTSVTAYDPEKSKQLLKEAGKTNLTLRLRLPSSPYAVSIGQVVKSQLRQVGIDAQIDVLEFPARWLDVVMKQKDFDMSIIQHVEPRDISTFANPEYYWGYDNKEVQELVAKADSGPVDQQVPTMKQVARRIAEDSAADVLFLFPDLTVTESNLTGVPERMTGESFNVTKIARTGS